MKHRGLRPASLVRYGPACRSIPQPCNGSARLGYSDRCPFTWQLEGPFSVAGWGRLLTSGLLSDPPRAAYSSSSKPFSYWGQVYAHSARPVNARPGGHGLLVARADTGMRPGKPGRKGLCPSKSSRAMVGAREHHGSSEPTGPHSCSLRLSQYTAGNRLVGALAMKAMIHIPDFKQAVLTASLLHDRGSGRYTSRVDSIRLLAWAMAQGVRLARAYCSLALPVSWCHLRCAINPWQE